MAGRDQTFQGGRAIRLLPRGQALLGRKVAEISQPLLTHLRQVIRECSEAFLQQRHVALGIGLGWRSSQGGASGIEQRVVQLAALRRQCRAALFDFAETCGVATLVVAECNLLLQRLEAGLAQQDRVAASGWPFDHGFRRDALGRHAGLDRVDVQGAWGQVVDVRAFEGHHVGNQAVLVMQLLILRGRDRGVLVPAEGVQGFTNELAGIGLVQAAIALASGNQFQYPGGEYLTLGQDALSQFAQRQVVDQLQAQQRGEHAERADMQRLLMHSAERGGVHRHAS